MHNYVTLALAAVQILKSNFLDPTIIMSEITPTHASWRHTLGSPSYPVEPDRYHLYGELGPYVCWTKASYPKKDKAADQCAQSPSSVLSPTALS